MKRAEEVMNNERISSRLHQGRQRDAERVLRTHHRNLALAGRGIGVSDLRQARLAVEPVSTPSRFAERCDWTGYAIH